MRVSLKGEERLFEFSRRLQEDLRNHVSDPAANRLMGRHRKRFLVTSTVKELSRTAEVKFVDINSSIPDRTALSDAVKANARLFISHVLEGYTSTCDPTDFQGVICKEVLSDLWRFGPGASVGTRSTHTAEKMREHMTCTSLAELDVQRLRNRNPYFSVLDASKKSGIQQVAGSKLGFVPKNEDTVRTIATEPSGNMALQLAAGQYLSNALKWAGLDIKTQQPKNKRLACIGSVTGDLATLDLSSASDRISIALVRDLMPPEWYRYLMRLRSPVTKLPSGGHVELNMISTMGNGYTFPLMTLLITSLVYAVRCEQYPRSQPARRLDWSVHAVFGDDIIVPTAIADSLIDVLQQAGLVVNTDKSYVTGPFRESCGGDYFLGRDITPFYVRSLTSPSDVYVAINQCISWIVQHEIMLPATMMYLASLVNKPFLVPEWEDPSSGILTPNGPRIYKRLEVVPTTRTLPDDDLFLVPLAAGGYVTGGPSGRTIYTLRCNDVRRKVRKCRIPQGFCDGSDPHLRSASASLRAGLLARIYFGLPGR